MAAITPSFLFDLESNMRLISETEYDRLNSNVWAPSVAKTLTSGTKKERINWLLETAQIRRPNAKNGGGQAYFEDLVSRTTEFEAQNAVAGLRLKKEQLDDTDANGVGLAASWARQVGAYAAYWQQKILAEAIRSNPVTYDNLTFFNAAHLVNPFRPSAGSFANDLTGAAAGIFPGAVPVNGVTVDIALDNLAKALAYIASIKMPSGADPRMLRLSKILHPPALTARMQQLTNAKFIAQAAATGGGSGDVTGLISNMGLGEPIEAPELASAFGGSDTTYYLLVEEITSNELGAFVYVEREPFAINFYGPQTDAQLSRVREFEWLTEGRNVIGAGHPYLMFRCQAT